MPEKKARRTSRAVEFKMPDMVGNPSAPTFAPSQVRILITTLDFTLLLADLRLQTDGSLEMTETARIVLSPHHAKALAGLLVSKVAEYEAGVGAINLPTTENE